MKVKDILATKGSGVVTCNPDNTLKEALGIFAGNKVGSLLVVNAEGNIQGIVAPRDILLSVLHDMDKINDLQVKDIMTSELIVATPDDTIVYIENIMTENRIRHIPILEDGKLQGIVSIGDVVNAQKETVTVENRYLKDYIVGKYPG